MLPSDSVPVFFQCSLQHDLHHFQLQLSQDDLMTLQHWLACDSDRGRQLSRMFTASRYVVEMAQHQPEEFVTWLTHNTMASPMSGQRMAALLQQRLDSVNDDSEFDRALRQFRRDMMLRILWRDLCRLAPMSETTENMTSLAEVVIQAAIVHHYQSLAARWGTPMGKSSGQPQPLVVLGMGKLGGWELNVSSDIDLIFTYPEAGETLGGRKRVSNQEFFVRLGQKMIQSIDRHTADGFVFRVDMRLRPYGQSGALVLNFNAMEEYYQTQGRDWERYAMIKARVVSGDVQPGGTKAGEALMAMLQPFIYRRYLDFSAIDAMRSMKTMINREVQRKGTENNVKLGAGGIRELEFVVQVFQMIHGGRHRALQERRVLHLLPLLEEGGFLGEGQGKELSEAYIFLRNTEHAIQGHRDQQSQDLPSTDEGQQRLAWVMGFDGWSDFLTALNVERRRVHQQFQAVISEPMTGHSPCENYREWVPLWPQDSGPEAVDVAQLADVVAAKGFNDSLRLAKVMVQFLQSRSIKTMQSAGRARLDHLMPMLLAVIHANHTTLETFERILMLLEAVARRTAYMVLLAENPQALQQLVRLCGASPWIADQLTRFPALLDELLDPSVLYRPLDKQQLRDDLRQQTLRIDWDDLETQMETLRYFKLSHALRAAANEMTHGLSLMEVSDYLTWLAEALLEHVTELAWRQMVTRHGHPAGTQLDDGTFDAHFIVLGYGKLGGGELSHGSDLDLVFVHDGVTMGSTDGHRIVDNRTFYLRLGQKIIHILNAQTLTGQLYEVDMRLRPSGNSGVLVSTFKGFEQYQCHDAWVWEHQALVRARAVCGSPKLQQKFEELRQRILGSSREIRALRSDVITMREKMRDHLCRQGSTSVESTGFNIKQSVGGVVDIEFMVQFLVLAWADRVPELTRYRDNIRTLKTIEENDLMDTADAVRLIDAYRHFRTASHRLLLQKLPAVLYSGELDEDRQAVKVIWDKLFNP